MEHVHAPLLARPVVQACVLLAFLASLLAATALLPALQVGLDQGVVLPADSYLQAYFRSEAGGAGGRGGRGHTGFGGGGWRGAKKGGGRLQGGQRQHACMHGCMQWRRCHARAHACMHGGV